MRRLITAGLGFVTALAASLAFPGPASAVDNVQDWRCTQTTTSLGKICVEVMFDNTNCDRLTTNNCVGLNGATVRYVYIWLIGATGEVDTSATLRVAYDVYGDGTSAYTRKGTAAFREEGSAWIWYPPTPQHDINRVCVRVRSATAATYDSGVNVGGINPYGLVDDGACGLP
ncbi:MULTISPECIES: hypothetical protein [Actinoplanes]|uniref:hypothetical protein n=1 Tax=Actinoplanes TaxID=1865 RepID=UPI0012F7F726|nr:MULTISPECIES: hypothetical protein [Actinoplanes]GLY02983.1 hypothetical protein Acsp01_33620 [Actinoplanes sp. NBRC 101535]